MISGKDLIRIHREEEKTEKRFSVFAGRELYQALIREYHIQPEMAAGSYIIAMTGPGDTAVGLDRFVNAMGELDRELEKNVLKTKSDVFKILKQEMKYTSWEAGAFSSSGMKTEVVPWSKAAGRTAMEYAYLYPPGIPFIVPGEKIGHGTAAQIEAYEEMGFTIEGTRIQGKMEVMKDG